MLQRQQQLTDTSHDTPVSVVPRIFGRLLHLSQKKTVTRSRPSLARQTKTRRPPVGYWSGHLQSGLREEGPGFTTSDTFLRELVREQSHEQSRLPLPRCPSARAYPLHFGDAGLDAASPSWQKVPGLGLEVRNQEQGNRRLRHKRRPSAFRAPPVHKQPTLNYHELPDCLSCVYRSGAMQLPLRKATALCNFAFLPRQTLIAGRYHTRAFCRAHSKEFYVPRVFTVVP